MELVKKELTKDIVKINDGRLVNVPVKFLASCNWEMSSVREQIQKLDVGEEKFDYLFLFDMSDGDEEDGGLPSYILIPNKKNRDKVREFFKTVRSVK